MLVLVVGPSGAGKDTLLDAARQRAGRRSALSFRPPRDHAARPMPAARRTRRSPKPSSPTRDFALQWQAHGLRYGIPADVATDVARRVASPTSPRTVIADAASRFPVRVIEVIAPPEILAARLAARAP